jgi:electron transfer flavoprotein alpha/beta subunit
MRVAVCCKAVPVDVKPDDVEIVDGHIRTNQRDLFINEVDAYALEAALGLKRVCNAEIWAIAVGPLRAQEALYIAMAKGIDKVLRVETEVDTPELTASALIGVLSEIRPQLVLTGVQSSDWMGGQVGTYVAHGLGMPVGFAAVEISGVEENSVRIKKEIGGGRKLEMTLTLPALLCVQSGIAPLKYVSAMKRRKMTGIPIKLWGTVGKADMPSDLSGIMRYRAIAASAPESRTHAEIIRGERSDIIAKILEIVEKNL